MCTNFRSLESAEEFYIFDELQMWKGFFQNNTKMNRFIKVTIIIAVLVLTNNTIIKPDASQLDDLNFLRSLLNYLSCAEYSDDGKCIKCSDGYIFNQDNICCLVDPQCKQFNRGMGVCEKCFEGYEIYSGQCVIRQLMSSLDRGCKVFENGKCVQCSNRWFFNQDGYCQQVNDNCREWDQKSGQCLGCYKGYQIAAEGQCQQIQSRFHWLHDPFCSKWEDRTCIQCAQRAFFGPLKLCIPVSDHCKTWDRFDGFCLTCYKGYSIANGKCVLDQQKLPEDQGCKLWDWDFQVCLECSHRWQFNEQGKCTKVSSDCKDFDIFGQCTSCYKGYDLTQNGTCILSQKNNQPPPDPGCKIWDWDNLICQQCSNKWYKNDKGICQQVDPRCKSNNAQGQCTQCFKGFTLSNSKCVRANPLCKEIDRSGKCLSCYTGYVLYEQRCAPLVTLVNKFKDELEKKKQSVKY